MIQTTNLQLIVCEQAHINALLRGKSALANILGVTVPIGWPHFPEAFNLLAGSLAASDFQRSDWSHYFFIHPADKLLIGSGCFKSSPDEFGQVEIGYEIASEYWNCGYATETARALIDFAFIHEPVKAVVAHTLAEENASSRVLQKVGMKFISEIDNPDDGKIWRWQVNRE